MKIVYVIARVVLGLMFFVFGLNGFVHFIPGAPPPGPAMQFFVAMAVTHYIAVVSGVQVVAGFLLLVNQYVPLALVALAAVLVNILTFHITMLPMGLPIALSTTALWFVVALPLRPHFAPLLARKVEPVSKRG